MADNVAITAGAGTNIATDDVSGAHYQRMKLDGGGDGAAAPIGGDATNGLDVDVTRVFTSTSATETGSWSSATTINSAVTLSMAGYQGCTVLLTPDGGTATTGIVAFEVTVDGTNWTSCEDVKGANTALDLNELSSSVSPYTFWFNAIGVSSFRVRLSSTITGTMVLGLRLQAVTAQHAESSPLVTVVDQVAVAGPTASGDTAIYSPVSVAGVDGSANVRHLKTDANGELQVDVLTVPAPLSTTGGGTEATALRVTVASDSTGVLSVDDNGSTLSVDDGGSSLTVDGSVAVSSLPALVAGTANIGDVDVLTLPALPAGTNNIGDVDVLTLPALPAGDNNIGNVDIVTMPSVTLAAGTANIGDVDVLSLPALPAGTNNIGDVDVLTLPGIAGTVAHDAADSGNPVKVGAVACSSFPTGVANSDRVNNIADLFGRQLTAHIDPTMQVHINKTYTSAQTGTDVWDPTAGKRIAVTSVVIGSYGTTAGRVILWFGDNADTTFTQDTDQVLVAASFAPSTTSKPGMVYTPVVPVFCNTADRELHITTDAALSIDVTIEGYEY
jgi:hypothetical protein